MTEEAPNPTDAHRETVRAFARPGGPLDPSGPNATTANPRWFFAGDVRRRTPERRALHRRLLDEARAERPAARAERRAIVLAGPPGAGKSTVLRDVLGVDASAWVTIDADEFKYKLLREALADGSYEDLRRRTGGRPHALSSEKAAAADRLLEAPGARSPTWPVRSVSAARRSTATSRAPTRPYEESQSGVVPGGRDATPAWHP